MLKQECILAATEMIEAGMIVGLGAGETITTLLPLLKHKRIQAIVTTSHETAQIAKTLAIDVIDLKQAERIDIAFDTCDEMDENLDTLKSSGGIFTQEKILAHLAERYILFVPFSKVHHQLQFNVPICLEILEDSVHYVQRKIQQMGGQFVLRKNSGKAGYLRSDLGNYLADVRFDVVEDVVALNRKLRGLVGVVETSLFTEEVEAVLISTDFRNSFLTHQQPRITNLKIKAWDD